MGTSIIIEAIRGEETTNKQWELIKTHFITEYRSNKGFSDDECFVNSGVIYCPYSAAYIREQIPTELMEELDDSGITINLWYEEREPDESVEL